MNKCFVISFAAMLGAVLLFAGCAKEPTKPTTSTDTATSTDQPTEGPKLGTPDAKAEVATPVATTTPAAEKSDVLPSNDDGTGDKEKLPTETIVESAEPMADEEVLLGIGDLTKGIPGKGPITTAEIEKWLADPKNHVVLKPALPLGLAAAAAQLVGLDTNPLTRAKIELGRQLYFDTRLSKDNSTSCATCHSPELGYAKDTQFGVGVGGQTGNRNSPVAYNRILSSVQFWDGRAATLEEQAKGPIANPIEMSNTHDVCVTCLGGVEGYKLQFAKVFPEDGLNIDNIAKAIATFERALVTGPSPWDYYEQLKTFQNAYKDDLEDLKALQEDDPELFAQYTQLKKEADEHPLSESARRGGELFFSDKTSCTACHVGANFTDEKYHNIGVGMDAKEPDLGRYMITKDEKEKGAFKTPTVRNVSLTAPYMHDGSQKTLEEVVEFYDKGGHPNQWLDEKIKPLKLTAEEKADLVAFMKALTGPLPDVETGRLPE